MTYDRVTVVDHPMVQHKLHILRDTNTPTSLFRQLTKELSLFCAYEATRDLPLEDIDVTTPVGLAHCKRIEGKKPVVVPILRAGLGMVDGVMELMPSCHIGHLGMARNEETHEPEPYYAKLPSRIAGRTVLLVDPMLATGGSAIMSVRYLRDHGATDIRFLNMVAAPEGIEALLAADPDVRIFTCSIDEKLNENAYIVPGLGDAGDRIFGTKGN